MTRAARSRMVRPRKEKGAALRLSRPSGPSNVMEPLSAWNEGRGLGRILHCCFSRSFLHDPDLRLDLADRNFRMFFRLCGG